MNKKSSIKKGEDQKNKSDLSLGKTLLRILGVGIAASAVLVSGSKKLGDTILNENSSENETKDSDEK